MAILQAFTKTAIDADRLLVQRARTRRIAGEEPGGRERAETACQGLGGAERTHEGMGLAQDALALVDAVRQEPRRARAQQHAPFVKIVPELAIERRGSQGLVVVGR